MNLDEKMCLIHRHALKAERHKNNRKKTELDWDFNYLLDCCTHIEGEK
jgi:hypothetical protein